MTGVRRSASVLATVVGVLALLGATAAWWAQREVMDSAEFAATARRALTADPVRSLMAEQLADEVVGRLSGGVPGGAAAYEASIRVAMEGVVVSDEFADAFEAAVETVHRSMLDDETNQVRLDLSEAEAIVTAAARDLDPRLAPFVPSADLGAVEIGDGDDFPDLDHADRVARSLSALFTWTAGGGLGAGAALAPDRARWARAAGLGIAFLAGLGLIVMWAAPGVAMARVDDEPVRAAAESIIDTVLEGLRWRTGAMGAAGLALAGVGLVASRRHTTARLV